LLSSSEAAEIVVGCCYKLYRNLASVIAYRCLFLVSYTARLQ